MDIRKLILAEIKERGDLKVADVVKLTGFSRVYIHRFFRELSDQGRIFLIGKANQARYIFSENSTAEQLRR